MVLTFLVHSERIGPCSKPCEDQEAVGCPICHLIIQKHFYAALHSFLMHAQLRTSWWTTTQQCSLQGQFRASSGLLSCEPYLLTILLIMSFKVTLACSG